MHETELERPPPKHADCAKKELGGLGVLCESTLCALADMHETELERPPPKHADCAKKELGGLGVLCESTLCAFASLRRTQLECPPTSQGDYMRVLLMGVGAVGEAIALAARDKPWLERMVLADFSEKRARAVQKKLGAKRKKRFPTEKVDASNKKRIIALARKHDVDLIMNAVAPNFNEVIFDAAFAARCDYMDMATTLSETHPTDPFNKPGVLLGDYQFAQSERWGERGQLALIGMGVDPGVSDIFARYAAKHLFDEIDEIGVRDGGNLTIQGYAFAPGFSIWTTIEECLNPPLIYDRKKGGWHTTEPFSEPEVFDFPEGIGPVEVVNVEHEEVVLIPRYVDCKRVTFKYGLGTQFIEILKMLHVLGLDRKDKIAVGDQFVAPRDVVVACLPNPATLGDKMIGKTCVGTWVKGRHKGKARAVYLYQVTDNQQSWRKYGVQAIAWQTGVAPVIAMELLARGEWSGSGVHPPEHFDPDPFMARMAEYDYAYGMVEMK
jgi:saccharopine dehydrogenase-like NADP-dependent oxidoreductase